MNLIWFRRAAAVLALSLALGMTACDDDSDDNHDSQNQDGQGNGNKQDAFTPNAEEQWIGAACGCVGSDEYPCDLLSIPVPTGSPISGCDNMPEVEGARRVCLRTISEGYAMTAPPTYFPQGYCALGAVECTGSNLCKMASYGDIDAFKTCPAGSVLMGTSFPYELMGEPVDIRVKTCAKRCNTDADCNTAGDMGCIERSGIKFCYNEKNFKYTGEPSVFAF